MSPQRNRSAKDGLIRLHSVEPDPPSTSSGVQRFAINGHPASLEVWTAKQWAKLQKRPDWALKFRGGLMATIRMG